MRTSSNQAPPPTEPTVYESHRLGQGLAVLRIFFGLILFANGISKLFDFVRVDVGWYKAILIDRDVARGILESEGARSELPLLETIIDRVMLDHWAIWEWVITFMELGVGALLILGLATRLAALAGLGQQLFLALVYFSSSRWMFEQPHEYVPLMILALVPAGRVWGLDGRIVRRNPERRRWPF